MNRTGWEFEYTAANLARAAESQRNHRRERIKAWDEKKSEVMATIKASGLTIDESVAEQFANYTTAAGQRGSQIMVDATLQRDLSECVAKLREHRAAETQYESWRQVLEAHPEARLKLKHDDWMYFFGK